uniref:Uncharacterized protein n=1 Tax=Solanum lycopersicum TaxID=4081 RepID=A0A3Q7HMV8_SOLLC
MNRLTVIPLGVVDRFKFKLRIQPYVCSAAFLDLTGETGNRGFYARGSGHTSNPLSILKLCRQKPLTLCIKLYIEFLGQNGLQRITPTFSIAYKGYPQYCAPSLNAHTLIQMANWLNSWMLD